MKRPIIWIACSFMIGILIGEHFVLGREGLCFLLVFLSVLSTCLLSRPKIFWILLLSLFVCMGAYRVTLENRWTEPLGFFDGQDAQIICLGEVRGPVLEGEGYYGDRWKRFDFQIRVLFSEVSSEINPVRAKVRCWLSNAEGPVVSAGDTLVLSGLLRPIPQATNPGQFDRRAFMAKKGVWSQLSVRSEADIVHVREAQDGPVGFLGSLRHRGLFLIDQHIPKPYSGLAKAIALGDQTSIERETRDAFQETGTVHLLAISGLHVGILAGLLLLILRSFVGSIPLRYGLAMILLIAYIPLTGAAAPVVRAVLVFCLLLFGRVIGRSYAPIHALAVAGLILLVIDPYLLSTVSFQFSFLAVLSILVLAPRITQRLERMGSFGKRFPGRVLIRVFSVSLAAWIGLCPLILFHFHLVSPVTLIANIAVLPFMVPIVCLHVLFFLFATVSDLLAGAMGGAIAACLAALTFFVQTASRIPGGFFYYWAPEEWAVIGYYCMVATWVFRRLLGRVSGWFLLGILIVFNFWAWSGSFREEPARLRIAFLDVGQGDAIVLEEPGGSVWVIDGGIGEPWDQGRAVVSPYLWSRGVHYLSALVATHPDSDHIGGLSSVLRRFRPERVFDNDAQSDSTAYQRFRKEAEEKRIQQTSLSHGDTFKGSNGLKVTCLHPPRGVLMEEIRKGDNNRSLVLKVEFGDFSALLCADIERDALRILLDSEQDLSATVLQIPHHGAKISPDILSELISAVKPRVAIVSVGARNRYGHPDLQTIRRISEEALLYRTDQSGAIIVESDGEETRLRFGISTDIITL